MLMQSAQDSYSMARLAKKPLGNATINVTVQATSIKLQAPMSPHSVLQPGRCNLWQLMTTMSTKQVHHDTCAHFAAYQNSAADIAWAQKPTTLRHVCVRACVRVCGCGEGSAYIVYRAIDRHLPARKMRVRARRLSVGPRLQCSNSNGQRLLSSTRLLN
jgi:hypothetical protein